MKTKEELVKTTLTSERGFRLAVVDLLADIRNSIIFAILSEEASTSDTLDEELTNQNLYNKALREMKRVITEESKDKGKK